MKWRGPMVDATAATVATVVTLAILAEGGLGSPDPGSRVLDEVGLLLAVASGLPLALCRRSPAVVFVVSALATIVLMYLGYPLDVPLGPVYAGYVLVLAWGGAGPVRRGVAAACVVGYVPIVTATYALAGVNIWAVTTELSTWGMAMVGVWLAAERTRLRQAQLDAAEERARRSEREAERENRLAAAEERTRIARELHDSAGHAINVILVQAGAARLLHERDPGASVRAISTVEDVARATIVDIDRIVHALRTADGAPVPADPAALEELLEHHRRSGLQLATRVDGERRPLPRSVAWAAYRILQEALTNAARHGSGSAEVVVGYGTHAMEIAVSNRVAGAGSESTISRAVTGTSASDGAAKNATERVNRSSEDFTSRSGGTRTASVTRDATAGSGGARNATVALDVAREDGGVDEATDSTTDVARDSGSATNGANETGTDAAAGGRTNGGRPAMNGGHGSSGDRVTLVRREPAATTHLYRPNGGHGLIGMRERAFLLGGTFHAGAEAGVFRVRVHLPYDAARVA